MRHGICIVLSIFRVDDHKRRQSVWYEVKDIQFIISILNLRFGVSRPTMTASSYNNTCYTRVSSSIFSIQEAPISYPSRPELLQSHLFATTMPRQSSKVCVQELYQYPSLADCPPFTSQQSRLVRTKSNTNLLRRPPHDRRKTIALR